MADYHREANWDSQLILKINKYYIRKGERNQINYRELWKEQEMRGIESEENRRMNKKQETVKNKIKKKEVRIKF